MEVTDIACRQSVQSVSYDWPPMPPSRARILLAEDEAKVAQPVVNRFTEVGHDIHWVRAVRDVRRELPTFSPDVLILDTTLDTDGLELLQALRFAPQAPPGGVVILTEPGDIGSRERAHQLGAAAVVSKPIQGDELVDVVADLLTFI